MVYNKISKQPTVSQTKTLGQQQARAVHPQKLSVCESVELMMEGKKGGRPEVMEAEGAMGWEGRAEQKRANETQGCKAPGVGGMGETHKAMKPDTSMTGKRGYTYKEIIW